jgi:hypothetical protein
VRIEEVVEPDPGQAAIYAALPPTFAALYEALEPPFRALQHGIAHAEAGEPPPDESS